MRSATLVPLALLLLAGCSSAGPTSGSVQIDPAASCTTDCEADAGAEHASGSGAPTPTEDPSGEDAGSSSATPGAKTPSSDSNTCAAAVSLGEIAGELIAVGSTADTKSAQDRCSKWFSIRVDETSKLPGSLAVKATLVSPPTTKFDLYAYIDTTTDDVSCTTPTVSSASMLSKVDNVEVDWPDNWLKDDSRTVTFEVRSRAGACDPSATWSLVVSNVEDPTPPSQGAF